MSDASQKPSISQPAWVFILFPAVVMLLAWGLRGYIGGGPYGAMMPGGWVALTLCLLLGYRMETAAVAAVFGAIGVGFGGNMTYGQTLGFLREADTVWWGLLGCFIKGGAWGLVGGAMLGVGMARNHYSRRTILIALGVFVVAFVVGRVLINDPKYPALYFSNLEDRPRDESWAGFWAGGLAFLAYLRFAGTAESWALPRSFAVWGFVGGSLGFFGGALWMVLDYMGGFGPTWWSSWKAMEFSFGFIFGGALGACAFIRRDELRISGRNGAAPPATWMPVVVTVVLVATALYSWQYFLDDGDVDPASIPPVLRFITGELLSFVFIGCVFLGMGLFSLHAAIQIAITLAFYHTVFDYVRDLDDPTRFGYTLSFGAQTVIAVGTAALVGWLVNRFQKGPWPISRWLLLAMTSCYLTGCVRSFGNKNYWFPSDGSGGLALMLQEHASLIFVHGTFTVSFIAAIWFVFSSAIRTPENQNS